MNYYKLAVVLFLAFAAGQVKAEFSPFGYGQSPFGYGSNFGSNAGSIGFNGGLNGAFGQANTPKWMIYQQMFQRFQSASNSNSPKSSSDKKNLGQTATQLNESTAAASESFNKALQASQEAFSKGIQPIADIRLGEGLIAALAFKPPVQTREPLAGLAEQISEMSASALNIVKARAIARPLTKALPPPAFTKAASSLSQRQPAHSPNAQFRNTNTLFPSRGIASLPNREESSVHRNMHSSVGHDTGHRDQENRNVRVIPFEQ